MANQWLRLWHDMPNDPKWRTISRASKQSIPVVISVYLHVLVNASNATERGRTQNLQPEDIASALDLEIDQVTAVITAMQGRVLDGDCLTGWEKRQPLREDGAAQRSKEWRERKRTQPNATERQDKDTEQDTEKEPKPSCAEQPPKASVTAPTDSVIALPLIGESEFHVTSSQSAEWETLFPAVDVPQELRKMRAWLLASPKKRKTRNGIQRFITSWLGREQDRGGKHETHQPIDNSAPARVRRANAAALEAESRIFDVDAVASGPSR